MRSDIKSLTFGPFLQGLSICEPDPDFPPGFKFETQLHLEHIRRTGRFTDRRHVCSLFRSGSLGSTRGGACVIPGQLTNQRRAKKHATPTLNSLFSLKGKKRTHRIYIFFKNNCNIFFPLKILINMSGRPWEPLMTAPINETDLHNKKAMGHVIFQ